MAHGYEELHAFRLSLEEISSQAFHARKKAKAMIRLTGGDNSLE
jgi:precorrin-4 methylase